MGLPVWYVHLSTDMHFGSYHAARNRNEARAMCLRAMHDANYDRIRYTDLRCQRCWDPWESSKPLTVEVCCPRSFWTTEVNAVVSYAPHISIDPYAERDARERILPRYEARMSALAARGGDAS